jgi:ethanolamine utilization protein EutM
VLGADAACKAAEVELLGWESIGGITTVFFCGSVAAVAASLQKGEEAAGAVVEKVVAAPLNQPVPACRNFVTFPARSGLEVLPGALGLIESRGYGPHVRTNDLMAKAAAVQVYQVLSVHDRVVCTLIRGQVGAVREAITVGRQEVESSPFFRCSAVIPQPDPQVLKVFGPEDSGQ